MVADDDGKVPAWDQYGSSGGVGMEAGVNFAPRLPNFDRNSPESYSS
jgi:hypothetical protein